MIQRRGIKIDRRVPGIDLHHADAERRRCKAYAIRLREARRYLKEMELSGDIMLIRFAQRELDKLLEKGTPTEDAN